MENMQWARGLFPLFLTTCTWVLMTSPAVCFLDHSSSKASSVLLISMSSIVAGQNTATVPSLSSVSMSSSKVFHSSTLALSSSSFVALSSGMAKELSTPALPLGSSKLVSSLPVVSKSVARLSRSSRSESSSVAMNSSWAFEQGTSAVTSVYSLLLSSSTISASSLQQSHLTAVVVGTTLEIDKSTPETPSPSSMLLPSSTVGSQQSECPTIAFLNETSGVITSPFYPRDYPNAVTCRWKITANRGKRIKLVITDMYLEWGGKHCPYDYLRIQNGSLYDSGVPYEPMCGRLTGNLTFYSFRETLTVLFVTDGSVTYRGFKATYIQLHFAGIPYTCTVGGSLTGSSGFISSPNFPNNYPQGSRCMWNITVPSGYMIRVSFHRFTLDSSPALDRVTITNVASGDGSQVLQLFGSFPPYPVYSVGNFTQLIFTSVTGQYSGFNATYTAITSACTSGKHLNGFSGFFSTPNFPSSFPQYSRCTWNITVPSGYIIKLSFLYFRLEPNQYSPCYYDAPGARVTATNVASDDGYQPFMLCGQSLPLPVYSVGNSVQVIFTSLSSPYPGFNASYTAITYSSVCPNIATLNETSGVLTSPYYPRRYPSNEKCSWKIIASKGERILLFIEDIDIRTCGSSCTCDYLEIQNGSSSDGISGRRRCRYYRDRGIVYHSVKDVLRVTFVSDSALYLYRGFKATYIKVKYNATNTACTSSEYLNGFSGFFSTPNSPSNYSQYSKCTWNITVPSGYIIKLSFLYFRLEPHQYTPCYDAPEARVTVTNVASDNYYYPFMLCGQSLPPPVYSVGNSVQVIFTSLSSQYPGFNASYTAVTYSSVCPKTTTLNEISGAITSPFYPRYYPYQNQSCSWEIRARKGKRIVFTIEHMDFYWWCTRRRYCLCNYLEIQGGSISVYDGPKWRVCAAPLTANVTYNWFKERIKVLFFSDGSRRRPPRFRISYTQVNFSISGCSNYTTLNESNRAMTHNRSISYLCDANLNGWYRFNGEAGTQMADSCVNMYHCGTESPGWLNGTHPDLTDGAVKRQVCFSSFDNCCHHSTEITVQHCGGFYVYKLEGQSHCNLRYCGNGSPYAQECYNYKVLKETSRSKTYNEPYFQCDNTLSTDWYRFSGAAGNQMAESCVDNNRCGTYYPGWLSGSHPTVNEGAVQRRVCFSYYVYGDCCSLSTYIRVRNCGAFFVYQLKPLTVCNSRYCGNGYGSSTPTTPELPQTTRTKVTPATGTQSTTDSEITPTRAMYSELENRNIVVIDIEKEIIGRRDSIRQKSCSK